MMGRTILSVFVLVSIVSLVPSAEARSAEPAVSPINSPLSPEESIALFRLADENLKVEIVASEPEVIDPVAAQFDEDGRLWVVEMGDYPHGPARGEMPKSRIKILRDLDLDGRFETATVFAEGLLFATELQVWRGGVIATLAGEVAYLKDTDGDGKSDVREVWYTGFAQENSQLRANHPRLGLDGWVYVSNGLRGGSVIDPRKSGAEAVSLSNKDFRFHPKTFQYEALTGVGQFGLTFDDFGNRFICSNRNPLMHVVLEERFIGRNPRYAPPAARHDVGRAGEESRIYPISRAWTTSNLHAGQFTAACGVLIFRGQALPRDYYSNGFTCDPTGNLVHREVMIDRGATFAGAANEDRIEFLASPDEWFRPVNLLNGPDGSLYVVDMYRAVIEHPEFMPDELKKRPDLPLGMDRGRIYRVTRKSALPPTWPKLSEASDRKLIELLGETAWHAETAFRLLYERIDSKKPSEAVVTALEDAVHSKNIGLAIRALWLLHGMRQLDDASLEGALRHPEPRVREQAIRIADASGRKKMLQVVRDELAKDADAKVRFWLLLALAPAQSEDDVRAIQQAAMAGVDDPWTRRAVAIAAGERSGDVVISILSDRKRSGPMSPESVELLDELIALAAAGAPDEQALAMLAAILDLSEQPETLRPARSLLRALAEPLSRRGKSARTLADSLGSEPQRRRYELLFAAADTDVSSPRSSLADRLEALRLLACDPQYSDTLIDVALNRAPQADCPPEMRSRAIELLSRGPEATVWPELLKGWRREAAPLRRAVLDAVLARPERVELLLDEIAAGNVRPAELESSYVNRLLKQNRPEIRARAEKLLAAAIPADRQQVLADYQSVLTQKADALRGREIFAKNCATCHRIGDLGVNVAPDISDSRVKLAEQLLTDILQPNRAIDNNYLSYSVVTVDGLSLTGIIASETATSVTLRQQEGKEITLGRSQIEELVSNGVSLMPEGLEKTIPKQDMADLISFIKNWRYLDGRTPLGANGD